MMLSADGAGGKELKGFPPGSGRPKPGEELILGYRLLQATPSDHTRELAGCSEDNPDQVLKRHKAFLTQVELYFQKAA